MSKTIELDAVYAASEDVVAREIEGEIIIVPLTSGTVDTEDALYTLNDTGREVWVLLDGKRALKEVVEKLSEEYESPEDMIEEDVKGLIGELLTRNIVVKIATP